VAHAGEELRLALTCFGQLPALVLDFVEQPYILDGDDCLVGKGGYQLDLFFGESLYPAAHHHENTDGNPLA
jgi:hypothetical protein